MPSFSPAFDHKLADAIGRFDVETGSFVLTEPKTLPSRRSALHMQYRLGNTENHREAKVFHDSILHICKRSGDLSASQFTLVVDDQSFSAHFKISNCRRYSFCPVSGLQPCPLLADRTDASTVKHLSAEFRREVVHAHLQNVAGRGCHFQRSGKPSLLLLHWQFGKRASPDRLTPDQLGGHVLPSDPLKVAD